MIYAILTDDYGFFGAKLDAEGNIIDVGLSSFSLKGAYDYLTSIMTTEERLILTQLPVLDSYSLEKQGIYKVE